MFSELAFKDLPDGVLAFGAQPDPPDPPGPGGDGSGGELAAPVFMGVSGAVSISEVHLTPTDRWRFW